MTAKQKVVLAYSGGLDTSVSIKWIQEKYDMDVIALTIDLGQGSDLAPAKGKALKIGAIKALVIDAKEMFVNYFVFPALQAGAIYEGEYPLATALGRPLIAKLLVDVARDEGAQAVAHGCTGKGNDQVRFDVSVKTLAPDLKIIGPVREWRMTRDEEIRYAQEHGIPVSATIESPYSTDQNLWGRSIEAGVLEDPWAEPPEEIYEWTVNPTKAPNEPLYLDVTFEGGIPIALNEKERDGVGLITELNRLAGTHGVGRIDHLENRLVGIKSREIYEAPAATVLHKAHQALETMTLSKDAARFKLLVSKEYADLIYNGLWFSALHQDLLAFIASNQRHVTGTVRVKLYRGTCTVVGRKSHKSLYSMSLATYDKGDTYDHEAAIGFIKIHGLSQQIQAQVQLLKEPQPLKELPSITPPKVAKESIETVNREE
ncbi:MAG: argininosuccinate synthase [Candidatus Tectomicrobia bacterium]|nr:argininosuccinate synthase [Candidatus Tectomicrobia bacterium]